MNIKKGFISTFLVLFFIAIFFNTVYAKNEGNIKESNTFSQGVKINGIDCSGLNVNQAQKKLTKEWNSKKFIINKSNANYNYLPKFFSIKTLKSLDEKNMEFIDKSIVSSGDNDKVIDEISNLNFNYNIKNSLLDILKESSKYSFFRNIGLFSNDFKVSMDIEDINTNFNSQFNDLSILKNNVTKKTKDAYINLNSYNFEIIKEVYGNNIDKNLLKNTIIKNIENGIFSMNYVEEDYYIKPKVVSTDNKLINQQEYLRNLEIPSITYKIYGNTEKVKKIDILKMYGISQKNLLKKIDLNSLNVDKEYVEDFVHKLALKYDTAWGDHTFNSTKQGKIVVSGGDYGYLIDEDKETEKLISILEKKKSVVRKPIYSQEGYKNAKDIGDSYVEIDLTYQTLWLYKDGKMITSMPVVTGNIYAGFDTPPGAYILKYKTMYVTLTGDNGDGTKYESPVKYWMPFNGGIGMHDANWRSSFGGEIYKGGGSHGCVNMPPSMAGTVYENIEDGYPIIVHY